MTEKYEHAKKVAVCWFCKKLNRLDWLYEEKDDDGDIVFERVYLDYCPRCGRLLPDYGSERRNNMSDFPTKESEENNEE